MVSSGTDKNTKSDAHFNLGFEESQAPYTSAPQLARVWTEDWVERWVYCPNCGGRRLNRFGNNNPGADFYCASCSEIFELKSKKGKFGGRIVDGAFRVLSDRVATGQNPNLALLNYNLAERSVVNLCIVPKQFFVADIIEKRRPLGPTAKRAGWVGCNIRLNRIPEIGKVFLVKNGETQSTNDVLGQWQKTLFLREQSYEARGWLLEVMSCCQAIGQRDFSLEAVYQFEPRLAAIYPGNKHIRQKIRQQLQVLRDNGILEFKGRGEYRLR